MLSKSVRLAVMSISIFSLIGSMANAAVIKEVDGGKSQLYVRIKTQKSVVFFDECSVVINQCRPLGSASGYSILEVKHARTVLKRKGWGGKVAVVGAAVAGGAVLITVGGVAVAVIAGAGAAGGFAGGVAGAFGFYVAGVSAVVALDHVTKNLRLPTLPDPDARFNEAESIQAKILQGNVVVQVPSIKAYISSLKVALSYMHSEGSPNPSTIEKIESAVHW